MLNKDKKDKVKPVVWSSGRGGAGNHHTKSKDAPKKVIIDPDLIPKKKVLEIETARNRSTAGGRGGRGNRYDHVLEPGVFDRVMQYESARIVESKATKEAEKSIKIEEPRARVRSILLGDTTDSLRGSTRSLLRSASMSTFATSVSGSSANTSSSNHETRSSTPASRISRKFFTPWKKRVIGGSASDRASISSIDNAGIYKTAPFPNILPSTSTHTHNERSSSLALQQQPQPQPTAIATTSTPSNLNASGSIESTSHGSTFFDSSLRTPSSSCSPPRQCAPPVNRPPRLDRPQGNLLPSSAPRGPRGPPIADRGLTSIPRSYSNVDVSTTANNWRNDGGFDGYPCLVEGDPQGPPFTPYHQLLKPNTVRHNPKAMRKSEGVPFI